MIFTLRPHRLTRLLGLGFILAVFPPASSLLHAQTPPPVLTFRLLSMSGSYGGISYAMDATGKGKPQMVDLTQGLSRYYVRPPGPTLQFFREFPVPPDSPPGTKPVRRPALLAAIPAKTIRCIIVTFPPADERSEFLNNCVFADDSKEHRAGTLMLCNASSTPAVIAVNDSQFPVAVGGSQIVPLPADKTDFMIRIALQKRAGWQEAYHGELVCDPKLRGYLFIADFSHDPDSPRSHASVPVLVNAMFETPLPLPPPPKKKNHDQSGASDQPSSP